MQEKYRGLAVCSVVLKVVAVVVVAVGIVVGLAGLISGSSSLGGLVGFFYSLLYGVLLYSFGEVIKLLLDIKGEVPNKSFKKE
jgi:hypothetical protein